MTDSGEDAYHAIELGQILLRRLHALAEQIAHYGRHAAPTHLLLEYDELAQQLGVPLTSAQPGSSAPVIFLPNKLPPGYVERPDALATLRAALLEGATAVGVVAATAVHGMGGLGKTVLARAICDDAAIRAAFPDGILWATLGQDADPSRHQRDWIRALGGDVAAASSLESGMVALGHLLADRAMLLVLDDVWTTAAAQPLQVGGPRCVTLLTTRDSAQAEGATLVPLAALQQAESLTLLQRVAGDALDVSAGAAMAARLGHLPLALSVVGALLARGIPWSDIAAALDEGDLPFLAHNQRSVLAVIASSVQQLTPEAQARYHELAIFGRGVPLDSLAVAQLWGARGELSGRAARRLLADLRDRALLQPDQTLHDLQYDYLQAMLPSPKQREVHAALVAACGGAAAWATLTDPSQRYLRRRLIAHLKGAGLDDDLRALLLDANYLVDSIALFGTAALLSDFALLPHDSTLEPLQRALELGAHQLDRAPCELPNQLMGRLGLHTPVRCIAPEMQPPLLLETQTLIPPGGALVRTLAGHTGTLHDVVLSPDGRLAFSASWDTTLRCWDVGSAEVVRVFSGHTSQVRSCALSPEGARLVSVARNGELRLWDSATGATIHAWSCAGELSSVAFSPDGRTLLTAGDDLALWDAASGALIRTFVGHAAPIWRAVFSPNGRLALSASMDHTLRLWDVAMGEIVHVLHGHTKRVNDCAISPDGRLVASASDDRTLRLWDVTSGAALGMLSGHGDTVRCCAFSPDSRVVLSGSWDTTMRLWDVVTGQTLRVLTGHTLAVTRARFSADGRRVLSVSRDATLRVWDITTHPAPLIGSGHSHTIRSCVINRSGTLALTASWDGTLRLWDLPTRQPTAQFVGHEGYVYDAAFGANGRFLISAGADGTIRLWRLQDPSRAFVWQGHTGAVRCCAVSPDGWLALSGGADTTVRLWNVLSGQALQVLRGHTALVYDCTFSPDGRLAVSGSGDATLRLWEVPSGKPIRTLSGHTGSVRGVTWSPDSRTLLSASADGTLRMWDAATGSTLRVLEGHKQQVNGCAWSTRNGLLLSAGDDCTLRVWEAASGAEVGRWPGDGVLRCCAWHPNAEQLIVGDSFGNLHFLRLSRPHGGRGV